MALLLKRFYLSRRVQFIVFVILLLFMAYYMTSNSSEPQDLTRRANDLSITKKAPTIPPKVIGKQTITEKELIRKLEFIPDNLDNRESVVQYVESVLQEALKEEKGTGCDIPKLDPFAKEVMQFDKHLGDITCEGKDWVKCYMSTCKVIPEILSTVRNIRCVYRDIIYISDNARKLGAAVAVDGDQEYILEKSDHVKIHCTGKSTDVSGLRSTPSANNKKTNIIFGTKSWSGHGIGFRGSVKPNKPPEGREDTLNVLIFGFDSTAKNGFIRKMPKSYEVLTKELGATVLNGYNIVGDGTPAALFPILTGKTELELPESRKSIKNSGHLDEMPFIFYKLKEDGYRTAYFEDMPWIGTFQYRFNGFRHQPADHYLRAFYLEESNEGAKFRVSGHQKFCVGDTPRYQLMINITDQFLKLDGKRFAFTFVADITHDDFNNIESADAPTAEFLRNLQSQGHLRNTLLLVMGDHGPRYANVRDTFQGKLEERLPLMAIRLPEVLKDARPEAQTALEANADALTTPHDIHAMILDALEMTQYYNPYRVKGADLLRGMTLLEPIPRNRSCSEATIEPHWCSCLKWEDVSNEDPLYPRVVAALVDHINSITEFVRKKCALRKLVSIQWVMKRRVNKEMLLFQGARDNDGYVGKFGGSTKIAKDIYQVKLTVSPGKGVYEAAVAHSVKADTLHVNTREISRTNAYGTEPSCISATYPHLNMFCYCNT